VVTKPALTAEGDRVTDDPRLLVNLCAGRPEACAELVRSHYPAVYRFLLHLTRDVHEAEDLTQETFIAAWQRISKFKGRSTLATWLHRIAYTKFIDSKRAKRRAAGMLPRLADGKASPIDPLNAAMAIDEAKHLYETLDALDLPERAVLVLHYLQGLSYREMAVVLDEPTGTVKWRTGEALNRLRALLSEEVSDHATRTTARPGPVT
jgi:RNA polymerase sigma-70 factor (ECF subfamily)